MTVRFGKWVKVSDPSGDEWQLISHRTGSVPPVGAPSLLPGPIKLLGEGPAIILDGWLINRLGFRGGWTVAVGPCGSRVGAVETRRCADRAEADMLLDRLVLMIRDGDWNPNARPIPD